MGCLSPFLSHFSSHWNSLPATHPVCSPLSFLSSFFFSFSLKKSEKIFQSDSPFYFFLFNIPLNLFIIFFFIYIFSVSGPLSADAPLVALWPSLLISAAVAVSEPNQWRANEQEGGWRPESTRRWVNWRAASTSRVMRRDSSPFLWLYMGGLEGEACNVCLDDARRGLERLLLCAVKACVWYKEHT